VTISVILAAYRSPFLESAVESVLGQSRHDWELIVSDDADSERTRKILRQYADSRIVYRRNSTTLGAALNHRKAIAASSGELVSFLNHDDMWEPKLLERLSAALVEYPDASVAFGDHWVIDESGRIDPDESDRYSRIWGRSSLRPGLHANFHELALLRQALPIAQCALVRRECLPILPGWVHGAYDFYIGVTLAKEGRPAVYVPERLARFRQHRSNLSGDRSAAQDAAKVRILLLGSLSAPPPVAGRAQVRAARVAAGIVRNSLRQRVPRRFIAN
jgi:glycosyltransferase involved in cell wall biosynthesis